MRSTNTAQHANPAATNEWSKAWKPKTNRARNHPSPKQAPRTNHVVHRVAVTMVSDATAVAAGGIDG
jgi:hypothetical protein